MVDYDWKSKPYRWPTSKRLVPVVFSHSYIIDGRGGEILAGLTFSLIRWFIIFVCCRPPLYPPPPPNVTKLTRPPSPLLAPPASIPCTRVEGGLARYHGSHFTPQTQLLSFLILKRDKKYFDFFGDHIAIGKNLMELALIFSLFGENPGP